MVDCQIDILDYDLPERDGFSIVFVVNTPWYNGLRIWRKRWTKQSQGHWTNLPEVWKKEDVIEYFTSTDGEIPITLEMWFTDAPIHDLKRKGNQESFAGMAQFNAFPYVLHIEPNPLFRHFKVLDVLNPPNIVGEIYLRINFVLWPELTRELWNHSSSFPKLPSNRSAEEIDSATVQVGSSTHQVDPSSLFGESPSSPLWFENLNKKFDDRESRSSPFGTASPVPTTPKTSRPTSASRSGPFSPRAAFSKNAAPSSAVVQLINRETRKRTASNSSLKDIFTGSDSIFVEGRRVQRDKVDERGGPPVTRSRRIAANIFGDRENV